MEVFWIGDDGVNVFQGCNMSVFFQIQSQFAPFMISI
jgi:hypothetical protein